MLALELTRAPPGVAGEHTSPRRRGHDLFRLVERGKAERAEERDGGIVGVDELSEDEHRVRLHRPAEPDLLFVLDERLELGDELGNGRGGGAVQDESCGALVRVLGHEDDRPAEVRVEQARGGDQELALERVHSPHCG